jgi:hypothetical protein
VETIEGESKGLALRRYMRCVTSSLSQPELNEETSSEAAGEILRVQES